MRKLHLVGLTTDRDGLIFTARKGSKSGGFIVPLDDRVLAAIADAGRLDNGAPSDDGAALPEVEAVPKRLRSESALTPREMQARLRAGRSIDEVAAEAGVDTEWVARFAVPILAEQAQVVELARALVYAKPRLGESSQPLGSSVLQNLSDRGVFLPDDVANAGWSAFQLHDSVWMVRFRYRSRGRDQEAQWEIDVPTGRLRARNRHASDLGYVDPGRWRAADPEAVVDDEETPVVPPPAKVRPTAKRLTPAKPAATTKSTRATKATRATRALATANGTRASRAAPAKAGKAAKPGRVAPKKTASTKTAATRSARTASTKAAPAGAKRSPRTTTAKSAPVGAKGSPRTASAKAPARRKAAKAVPASETGPTAGSGGARMAAAQVSTARVAASMATADREPWAAAVRRPSRSEARSASPGARGTDGLLRPATPDPDDVRAFDPRPLPRGRQEPARPRVRKVTVPRPGSTADEAPTMTLPAPRQPVPAQEPMPVERSKRRRLRSR
ncbi:MAG TPA: septation protein SepH [Acidimicrobiales bacterium]|nr:septation protein SepH [Acidimicrobiales bacterium]